MIMPVSHVLYLLRIAAALSGYDMLPDPPPTVFELTTIEMYAETCSDTEPDLDCMNTIGYYRQGDEIWINAQWAQENPQVDADSITVHELTHWLQAREGRGIIGFGPPCLKYNAREVEAYHVQERFIREYEHKKISLTPELKVCK
jgi:hypothetical protein